MRDANWYLNQSDKIEAARKARTKILLTINNDKQQNHGFITMEGWCFCFLRNPDTKITLDFFSKGNNSKK